MENLLTTILSLGIGLIATAGVIWWCIQQEKQN
jgi:hypothetical protein